MRSDIWQPFTTQAWHTHSRHHHLHEEARLAKHARTEMHNVWTCATQSTSFCRPTGYNPKKAPNVYRLIGAALIGNFFDVSFLF